jgi:hypothetical protein
MAVLVSNTTAISVANNVAITSLMLCAVDMYCIRIILYTTPLIKVVPDPLSDYVFSKRRFLCADFFPCVCSLVLGRAIRECQNPFRLGRYHLTPPVVSLCILMAYRVRRSPAAAASRRYFAELDQFRTSVSDVNLCSESLIGAIPLFL